MLEVTFKKLIQTDPFDKRGWIQFTATGSVKALPPLGTLIFIRKLNENFVVHGIHMTSEEYESKNEINLIEIVPAARVMSEKDREILEQEKIIKGWIVGDLADNLRDALILIKLLIPT